MYQKSLSSHLFSWLHTGLLICLVAAVVLSVLPTGLAQADADSKSVTEKMIMTSDPLDQPLSNIWNQKQTNLSLKTQSDLASTDPPPPSEDYPVQWRSFPSHPQPLGGDGTRSPDVHLDVNYAHDWVSGLYVPGYDVSVEVRESDNATVKALMSTTTGPIPWWDGASGFDTDYADSWVPDRPDIQPGDWVHASVDLGGGSFDTAQVQVGTIVADVDIDTDSITGTVDVPWLDPFTPVDVICHPWGAPGEVDPIFTTVLPDGSDEFSCSWNPATEWDVEANQYIAISYLDPTGHWIYDVFVGYTNELIMNIHYDHNWIDGSYEPGHTVNLTVYDSGMSEKAHITMPTGPIDDWGGQSGFATDLEGMAWVPERPDIQPGDVVHGEVDDGSLYSADVEVGMVTGTSDVGLDIITGTVDTAWLMPGPVDVGCYIWEEGGPENKYDTVTPDGADTYECSWSGEWDIVPGTFLMVAYFEPDGHQLIGDFTPPAPYLLIEKWFMGESPGEGGNAAFGVGYQNQGELPAEDVTITDTLVGMTYLGDNSGFPVTVEPGDQEVTWDLGTVDPGDWIYFEVYADVTETEGNPVSNTVWIETTTPYDDGDESEKISTWEGTVAANDTHLNVSKWPWTENPAPGEDFVYTVNVCNNGSTSSSTVTLTDTLPDATTYVTWWSDDVGWVEVSQIDQTLELEHTCVSSWSCSEVYIRVTLDEEAQPGEVLTNQVEIDADNDMETEDNTAEYYHQVGEPYMDLGIWQDWHGGSLVEGGQYCYGVTFRNEGNVAVGGPIAVTATHPAGTSFAGWDSWGAAGGIADPGIVGNVMTWAVGDMIAGAQGTIQVCLDIDPGTAPDTVLAHLADIDEQPGEENTENNHDEFVEVVRDHGPNLRVQKWGDWSGEEEGQYAQYYIQVENIGDEIVEDVILTDYYPDGMELDGDVHVDYWGDWELFNNDPEDNAFTAYLDKLEPGWSVGIHYDTYVREDYPLEPQMVFSNIVEVMPLSADIEPANNFFELLLVFDTEPESFDIYLPLILH